MSQLIYIHHSGFFIEGETSVIVIDYYTNGKSSFSLQSLPKKNMYIMASHSHGDHFSKDVIEATANRDDVKYIFSKDIEGKIEVNEKVVYLSKNDTFEDKNLKVKAFGSTDEGVSFYIEWEGKKIFHAGDLNNWHWNEEVPQEEAETYQRNFLNEVEEIALHTSQLDLAMFPVDPRLGKDYALGAIQFLSKIKTKVFAPMHFWGDYNKANAFVEKAEKEFSETKFIRWQKEGERAVL